MLRRVLALGICATCVLLILLGYSVRYFETNRTKSQSSAIARDPILEAVSATKPNWDHQNIGRLNEVWRQFGANGDGIVVAILDTGIDPDHPDLVGKLAPQGWIEFALDGNS